ncbi:MAG: acyl carrier protein [Planctomycetota bacterium]|nr:acyl carrier protein [Planctomycetota bacterium]
MDSQSQMLLSKINQVLVESGREPVSALRDDMRLRKDLGLDSLELAVLTVKIEAATGIDIFENGLVDTVGQVAKRLGN